MPRIRPFVHEDITQVASLHRRVFDVGGKAERELISKKLIESYTRYFDNIILDNPWRDSTISSLVYENESGRITGFLGVMPRQMMMDGRSISVALSSQFVVEQESRSSGVGIRLLQAFLAGPQELSLTDEANHTSRRLWEALGGTTALAYSFNWTRLLRPSEYVASQIQRLIPFAPVSALTRPFVRGIDRILVKKYPQRFQQIMPNLIEKELTIDLFLENYQGLIDGRRLQPEYDMQSLQWLSNVISHNKELGSLRKVALYKQNNDLAGWYMYLLKPGGKSSLIQLLAKKNVASEVLDHLFHDALLHGSNAITGRLDPQHSLILAEKYCTFACGTPWMLIHSHNKDLIQSICLGEALLTGLEGEFCMRFVPYS
ncbi:MAG: hypothetical protein IPM55_03115 [Acidobacteria bacterium]|nr:hypothetical protein [Acidobacteriota bacterium]